MMINAGEMRHRVSIQRQTTSKDVAGEALQTWDEVLARPAAMMQTPGAEIWASAQRSGRVPTVFRLRYESGITPGMRLVHEKTSKVFNILSVFDPSGRGEEMVITAEELVTG